MSPQRNTDSLRTRALLALLLCALCGNAWARKSDRQQPMDVNADHSEASLADDGVTTLTGNVVMTQGTLQINADKAVITRKDGDMSRAVLTGNPVHLKQMDENNEPMYGSARQVDDDLIKNIAIFTGNAIIDQPVRGQMHGEKIVYNVDSGEVTSGGDGTRVSMHILPKAKPATAPSDKSAADKSKSETPAVPPPDLPPGKTP
jgi:lipopolysaccharide export system protein LptA